jgi:hypothetical protein
MRPYNGDAGVREEASNSVGFDAGHTFFSHDLMGYCLELVLGVLGCVLGHGGAGVRAGSWGGRRACGVLGGPACVRGPGGAGVRAGCRGCRRACGVLRGPALFA